MKFNESIGGRAKTSDRSEGFALGYSEGLDGLRGLSVLAVLAFNGHMPFARGGFIGVDLFFVLSGFLITSLLVKEHRSTKRISLKSFYYRRALRLLPALLALMLFCALYATFLQPSEKAVTTFKGILYTFFYVANWAQIGPFRAGIGPLSHAWSLSVEEQFYILWPLLLIVLLKIKRRPAILVILLTMIAVSTGWSSWLWHHEPNYLRMYFGSDTRANELLIGCAAGLLVNWNAIPQTRRARLVFHFISLISAAAILYSMFAARHYDGFVYNGGFTLISLGAAVIIIDVVLFRSPLAPVFTLRPLMWIGKISYGLYLWHFPVFLASKQALEGRLNPVIYDLIRFGSVFLIATVSYYVLERPFLKLRVRYSSTQSEETNLTPLLVAVEGT